MQDLFLLSNKKVIVQNQNIDYQDTIENFLLDFGEVIPQMKVDGKLQDITAIDYNKYTKNCWLNGKAFQTYPNDFCEKVLAKIEDLINAKNQREKPSEPTQEELNQQEAERMKSNLETRALNSMMLLLNGSGELTTLQTEYQEELESVSNDVALYMVDMFPLWSGAGVKYEKGKRVQYNGVLYEIVKEHVSQENWKPDITPSEYVKVISSISGEIPEWQQPSAENAYKKGDKVKYEGRIYESLIDNNVWKPTEYSDGWKDITDEVGE